MGRAACLAVGETVVLLALPIETPIEWRGGCSRMTVSTARHVPDGVRSDFAVLVLVRALALLVASATGSWWRAAGAAER